MSPLEIKYIIISEMYLVMWADPYRSHKKEAQESNATSAGFFKICGGKVHCYGHSHTLKMGVGKDDEAIISRYLGLSD